MYRALKSSVINCSEYSNQSIFTYSNETVQNIAIELLEFLSNITNGSYCIGVLNRFLCNIIFPPYQQSSDETQRLCVESCKNYVSTGICAVHVKEMIKVLDMMNMTEIALDLQHCRSPLFKPNNNLFSNCTNLPGRYMLCIVQCGISYYYIVGIIQRFGLGDTL